VDRFSNYLPNYNFNFLQEEANSNHVYREEYETYELLQRRKIPPPQTFEFAETEFRRPSYYLSVPFRSQNRLQVT